MGKLTSDKTCYCHTCNESFHYLGINSHRAMHRRRKQDCEITYTHGDTHYFPFSEKRSGIITQVVPKNSFLHPYIGYEVLFDDAVIILDKFVYDNDGYEKLGYISPK